MKYGDEGDSFQLVVKGEVTVWIPMKIEDMAPTIEKLRLAVLDSIGLIDFCDELLFSIKVYFDPWKFDDDNQTKYASFNEYDTLVD